MQRVRHRYGQTDPFRHSFATLLTNHNGSKKQMCRFLFRVKRLFVFQCKDLGTQYLELAFVRDQSHNTSNLQAWHLMEVDVSFDLIIVEQEKILRRFYFCHAVWKREDGGEERKIGKNGGNFWGRPRPGRGCIAMDGWMLFENFTVSKSETAAWWKKSGYIADWGKSKGKSFPTTGLSSPWVSGRLRLRIFSTFGTMKVVRSWPLRTGRLYPQEFPGTHF